ncbi:hypothetical protein SBRY_90306 [Actinacidiphila bryophytorum]|uniref:Tc1-like transposase DDE domain-containing protein n=1 Tax=Actinacidiphila bryophytorum TaxID=1436133 RepID=A0A9W4H8Y2_9ACTN|nr:hypothetical protein SBRY_90306 [Actinacidiphila bryophytorum]
METVDRPAVREQGPRRGGHLPRPAGERPGPGSGREVADPGPGPDPTGIPDGTGHAGEDDARLHPARHDQPVRRSGHRLRLGHRPALPPPPPPGVPPLLEGHRRSRPPAPRTPLVLDNYATHKTEPVKKWLLRHPRFHLHFTPTSASWLNLVERWFAKLTCRKLRRSAHRSVVELERDIRGWINEWNKNPKPFVWMKTADDILDTLAAYCTRINDSGH